MEKYTEQYQIGKTLKHTPVDDNGNKYFVINRKSGKIIFYFEKHYMSIVKIVLNMCSFQNKKIKKLKDNEMVGWKATGQTFGVRYLIVKLKDGSNELTPFCGCDSEADANVFQDFFCEHGIYLKEVKN